MKKTLIVITLVSLLTLTDLPAGAETISAALPLKAKAAQSVSAGILKISLPDGAVTANTSVKVENLGEASNLPWNYNALTPVYQFDFADKGASYDRKKPLRLQFSYGQANNYYKQIFFYDGGQKAWRALPSVDDPLKKTITADIHLPFARIAVLANPQILTVGKASWYRYKGGLFAASPDFKAGTLLKVTNLANGKAVTVTVNDFGPDRKLHPDRVVDLDAVAFAKIASTKDGIIRIKIEPIKLIASSDQEKLTPAGSEIAITSKSAVVYSEKNGVVLYGKQASSTSPLASLTKLVAAQVFLDTNPTLSKIVSYSVKDEEYNNLYCKPWESARLRVSDGETLTIQDLLYAALVGSANNAVESLVRVSGLSRPEFIAKMNEKAAGWGATSTRFVEPSGLSPENVSSPFDYAIMTKEIFKNPLLKKISSTLKYSFTTLDKKIKHNLSNTNSGLLSSGYNITGSKTGYLDEAGYCLMTRVESPFGGMIVVNFGAKSKADNFKDNEKLINYGLKLLSK
ncbi:MAG: RlpA-like double-psi beta-barrel domain-containing protein [Bacillota bacterium]